MVSVLQVEALLVAAPGPVSVGALKQALPGEDAGAIIEALSLFWKGRGMQVRIRDEEVSLVPSRNTLKALEEARGKRARRLSQAAVETLSYIAINQPVSLADIEEGRGVRMFKGVMDSLMDAGLVRASVRRSDSGRAVVYVTTDTFLENFGLSALADLPTAEEISDLVGRPARDGSHGE